MQERREVVGEDLRDRRRTAHSVAELGEQGTGRSEVVQIARNADPGSVHPRRHQSGSVEQQLRISKAGNKQLRSLLVQCAQYLLGRFGTDSDLERWGTRMFERGGKIARNEPSSPSPENLQSFSTGCGFPGILTILFITLQSAPLHHDV